MIVWLWVAVFLADFGQWGADEFDAVLGGGLGEGLDGFGGGGAGGFGEARA